jgi:glycosyltransferase involved in cell wall biosynthesis
MAWVIVIPAYQAALHIRGVLDRIAALDAPELKLVVVVNDGSSDETSQRVREAGFTRCELRLIERPRNGGYGAAMKDGLDAARQLDPEIVACIHADGQYSPEVLPALCSALSLAGRDLIQGSRIASGTALSGGMPRYKFVANALLNRLENHTLGLSLTDYHSGYLVYGRRALALGYRSLSDSFDFDLELIACARAHGLSVGEAPIPTHYGDEVSHLNPVSYGLRVLRVMWNYRRGRYAAA